MVNSFAAFVVLVAPSMAFAPTKTGHWTARKSTQANFRVTLKYGDTLNVSAKAVKFWTKIYAGPRCLMTN